MDSDDFDNVSWRNDPTPDSSRPNTAGPSDSPARGRASGNQRKTSHEPLSSPGADAVDLAGIGEYGRLDVTVGKPLKENDGTKDAYVSYLVSTEVCSPPTVRPGYKKADFES